MAPLISTVDKQIDKAVYAIMQHGLSETVALSLIIDVCKGRLNQKKED